MTSALVLIVMGVLILLERMGTGYSLREGWPWIVIVLGVGGIIRKGRSLAAWITTILGAFILGAKYYSVHISVPAMIKTYLLPVLLLLVGLLWLWRYKKD